MVRLKFSKFDIEHEEDCNFDFVEVRVVWSVVTVNAAIQSNICRRLNAISFFSPLFLK